ncbi:MAG: GNAT family N-acetyltransferase [Anaerolineae bacterium]|jgi:GNAT superfamily N-acetyltransferase|nr:GNAT family N-acetyltransferase [Chloroflexota bacterium]
MYRRGLELESDYPALLEMERQSWRINFPGEYFVERAFRRELEFASEHDIHIYEEDGDIVAWLWLDLYAGRDRAHIRHLQVAEPYWGQGIGRFLVNQALLMAAEAHREQLTLNVTKSNLRAMRLYSRSGFVVLRDMGERQHMGRWVPPLEPVPDSSLGAPR